MYVVVGYLRYPASDGLLWSETASAKTASGLINPSAYNFHVYKDRLNTAGGADHRWHGFPLRCLAAAFSCLRFSKNVSNFLPRNRSRLTYTFSKT